MTEIIPAVIGKNIDEISEKISLVAPYVTWVQIDVSDGIFTPNVTWNNPEELSAITSGVSLEMHLMIANPADHIDAWINSGAKRIIVHVAGATTSEQVPVMVKKAKEAGASFGIALNPDVLIEDVKHLVPLADVTLLLAVSPGFSGQEFNESIIGKITDLRKEFPDAIIEVDGGINPETAKKCVAAGANRLVSASYIFDAPDIKQAIDALKS